MLKKIYLQFKQRAISTTLLIGLLAIYQAIFLNMTYYKHVLTALSISRIDDLLFFCTMPIVIFVLSLFY